MMGFLTDYIVPTVQYKEVVYKVNTAFDSVLNIQRMYKDTDLEETDKLDIALNILIERRGRLKKLSYAEKTELIEIIYKEHINLKEHPKVAKQKRVLDFEEDGEYIYASFMQEYGIDLVEQQGRLPWKKFIALFQGLGEKTKIKEVMRIRGMDIPEPNKYNQKEIRQINELKMYYSLPISSENGENGLDLLFNTLERMAEKSG